MHEVRCSSERDALREELKRQSEETAELKRLLEEHRSEKHPKAPAPAPTPQAPESSCCNEFTNFFVVCA